MQIELDHFGLVRSTTSQCLHNFSCKSKQGLRVKKRYDLWNGYQTRNQSKSQHNINLKCLTFHQTVMLTQLIRQRIRLCTNKPTFARIHFYETSKNTFLHKCNLSSARYFTRYPVQYRATGVSLVN